MIEHFFPNPAVLVRLHAGPLGAYVDAFARELSERGYAVWTAQYAMRLLAALGTWLVQKDLAITDLDEPALEVFLLCRYREFRQHRDDRSVCSLSCWGVCRKRAWLPPRWSAKRPTKGCVFARRFAGI